MMPTNDTQPPLSAAELSAMRARAATIENEPQHIIPMPLTSWIEHMYGASTEALPRVLDELERARVIIERLVDEMGKATDNNGAGAAAIGTTPLWRTFTEATDYLRAVWGE